MLTGGGGVTNKKKKNTKKVLSVHWLWQALRWSTDRRHLKAWQRGRTGYPLVDAAMRQLWLTGWMNNYTRHVVASFLIVYLHLPWQEGYRWFQVRKAVGLMSGRLGRSTGVFMARLHVFPGHPGGCRCGHRCHDVAEWGHVWPGPLELCHAPRQRCHDLRPLRQLCQEMVSGTVGASGRAHPQTLEMSGIGASSCW